MSREHQLRSAEENEQRASRIRARFGLPSSSREDDVRDWLLSAGAIPMALGAAALGVYLLISIIGALGS